MTSISLNSVRNYLLKKPIWCFQIIKARSFFGLKFVENKKFPSNYTSLNVYVLHKLRANLAMRRPIVTQKFCEHMYYRIKIQPLLVVHNYVNNAVAFKISIAIYNSRTFVLISRTFLLTAQEAVTKKLYFLYNLKSFFVFIL